MEKFGLKMMLAAASIAAVVASTGVAYADDDWGTLSADVAVTSDYRFRGISQNNREFTPQASINWSGPDGFYAGTWLSKTDRLAVNTWPAEPSFEADFYAGKYFDLGGTDLNVEAYYYSYPDFSKSVFNSASGSSINKMASYFEGIFQLSHTFGSLALTGTFAISPQFSLGGGTGEYLEATASYPINDWLSVSGNVGHQWVELAPSDYTHFDIGLFATWHNLVFDARYTGTDMNTATCGFYMITKNACTGGFVGTFTYNIPHLLN